jgi:predicted dehydrogenase
MACHVHGRLPVSVSCLTGSLQDEQYRDTEDTALLTLQFEDDARLIIDLSWAASFRNSYYAMFGTGESIIVENDKLCHKTRDGELVRRSLVSEFNDPSHRAWFGDMFQDFKCIVANPDRQWPIIQEALVASLVIERAYASAHLGGKWVDVPRPSMEFL